MVCMIVLDYYGSTGVEVWLGLGSCLCILNKILFLKVCENLLHDEVLVIYVLIPLNIPDANHAADSLECIKEDEHVFNLLCMWTRYYRAFFGYGVGKSAIG